MEKSIFIDEYSPTSCRLELTRGPTTLAQGTGFFWRTHDDKLYLVTNWHNVTGIHPITGQHLSPTGGEPDWVVFGAYPDGDINRRGSLGRGLYLDDGSPAWLEHPEFGRRVDVVCLPLQDGHKSWVFPINTRRSSPLKTTIADEVFVLGFPGGVSTERLPIWKRGSVASEPDIDVDGLPLMYIDTASSSGMSGSPVLQRSYGGRMEDNVMQLGGRYTRFLGVYSGRLLPEGPLRAQLGHVWKARVIEEIILGGVRGSLR